ncbi:HET-domain-containing protein [Hypoxylon cercidicola]|nr:HET-domain-containing protein [Hypoxylon cercidicola]
MIIYLEEGCISIELRPSSGDERKQYVYIYRSSDSISEQSAALSTYEHIPILPDINLPNSEKSFNYLKNCLKTCVETDDECRQDLSSPPRRLLRIGSPGDSVVSLYETPATFREPYVALSYCWGKKVTLRTTRENIQSLMKGFDLAELPATIRDAIHITRKLGLKYIWIDALCIIQLDKQDWEEQSVKMCSIYEQAYLTIAAFSAGSSDVSFANPSSRPLTFHYRIADEPDIILAARVECTSGHHYNPTGRVLTAPETILTRGWTLQESILATRCISYSTDELQWRCRSESSCECEMPGDWRRDIIRDEPSFLLWNQVVEQYTQRQLSFPGDKLPALSGICQLISSQVGSWYLAGLWEDGLPYCLLWEKATDVEGSNVPVPPEYRAPSFSWASLDCPVYPFTDVQSVYQSARVVDSTILLEGIDPFGLVKPGASITAERKLIRDVGVYSVEGRFAAYRIRPRGTRDEEIVADGLLEAFGFQDSSGLPQRSVRRSTRDASQEPEGGDTVLMVKEFESTVSLFLVAYRHYEPNKSTTYYFLVLSVSSSNHDAYERLGTIGMGYDNGEFDDVPEQTITIL